MEMTVCADAKLKKKSKTFLDNMILMFAELTNFFP